MPGAKWFCLDTERGPGQSAPATPTRKHMESEAQKKLAKRVVNLERMVVYLAQQMAQQPMDVVGIQKHTVGFCESVGKLHLGRDEPGGDDGP